MSANNTIIKVKRSFANSAPNVLLEGELAYSYLSNTLFIGSSANTPISIAIANVNGRLVAVEANSSIASAAYNRANQAYSLAESAANTARVSRNGTGTLSNKQLNFVDTATATFSVSDAFNGNANIGVAVAANLGVTALSTDYISFTQLPYTSGPSYNEGRMWYNQNAHSIQFQTDFPAFDAVPGQIEYVRVYNNTGAQIDKGKPVYVTGVKGSGNPVDSRILSIALADATDGNKKDVLGLAGHNIPNGSEGFVLARGPLYGVDTSSLVADQRFHLGAGAGLIVASAPEYPNWPMDLGTCLTSDPVNGSIYVDIIDHSFERMRVLYDSYIGGSLVVEGDLTVLGTQNFVSASDFYVGGQFLYLNSPDSINIESTVFTGSGLNDMTFKGNYTGDPASTDFYVRIASQGVQGISSDTFDWSYNSSFSPLQGSNISITSSEQLLANGISVKFVSILGHTTGDQWSGTAYAKNKDFGIIGHYNDGAYTHSGLFRDSIDGEFKFFNRYVPEPEGNIDATNVTFQLGNVRVQKISANSFFAGGIDLLSSINSAANATAVYSNGTLTLSNAGINFVNTSTIRATISTGSGLANISFDLIGSTGGIASFPVASGSSIVSANGLNFVNSATVAITVSQGISGNANISFTTLAGGGSVTQVDTGTGLVGGPITTSGTISANIASTSVQGVTKLIDSVTSTDAANAATAASVRTAFNQGTSAYGQANAAFTQANSANSIAISAYGQANAAYTQANTANSIAISAYGQANAAYNQANTANSTAVAAYGQANAAFTQANVANSIAISAYGQANQAFNQANAAYAQANSANSIAVSAYSQANAALSAANNGSNTVRISANSGSILSNVSLNFVNTSTVQVSVTSGGTGIANIAFTSTATGGGGGTGTLNNFPVSVNTGSTVTANGINFINSSSVTVSVTQGVGGNANISFTAITSGTGTVTSVDTGLGLTGGPINSSGVISANIASTTVQGVTKLIDSVTSTDTANAATAASVKTAFDQATTAYGQANAAFTQANSANSVAVSAYGQANLAYAQANTANSTAVAAYGQANSAFTSANNAANTVRVTANSGSTQSAVSLNFINTSSVQVSVGAGSAGNANVGFNAVSGSTTIPGIVQLNDTVTSTSTTLAATANAVKTTYDFAATKYSSTGGTISGDVTITGNLILTGGTSQLNVTNLSVNDSIILLGSNNIADVLDIGFVGHYRRGGTDTHAGLIRKATDKTFYLFDNYEVEPTNNVIDITGNNFRLGNVRLGIMNANSILVLGTPVATITDVGVAYGQANAAYTQANLAYGQANLAYGAANNAANTVRVTANSGSTLSNVSLNFVNTSTVQVSVTSGGTGIANIAFTSAADGITSVATGTGLTGGTITSTGTISANIASTTVVGVTKLVDSVTSADTANAATAASVKTAFDQATLAYGVANTANATAVSAYGQANAAFAAANTGLNKTQVSANGGSVQTNVSVNFINTASIQVTVGAGTAGNANVGFSAVAGSTTVAGILQLTDSVTSTSTTTAATPNSVKTAFDQATLAYGQANTANSTAVAAYGQANLAYAAANSAANAVRVTANSGSTLTNVSLNFVNTSTVQVSVTSGPTGFANIAFTSTATAVGGSGINNFPVSANTGATVSANGINFVNSATVTVTVTQGINGNANVSFTSSGGVASPGGSNTQIQFNNNGTLGGTSRFTYNTAPNLVSVDADLKLANTNKLYFGGEQANNSVANSKFSISFNVSATSLDFTFLG